MRKFLLPLLGFALLNVSAIAQIPRFSKYSVKETGAFVYMPAEPNWTIELSEDQSKVYSTQVQSGTTFYGVIVVELAEQLPDDTQVWENLLSSYMVFLHDEVFQLLSDLDLGYGHKLECCPSAIGILEYGEDVEGIQYSIKGWVNRKYIAVLWMADEEEPNINYQQLFLNGFRFP
jgi:hypothetical protein